MGARATDTGNRTPNHPAEMSVAKTPNKSGGLKKTSEMKDNIQNDPSGGSKADLFGWDQHKNHKRVEILKKQNGAKMADPATRPEWSRDRRKSAI